jgi:pyridoxine 5-phosphate synthase
MIQEFQWHSNLYFCDPSLDMIEGAKTDRINYTLETFAHQYGLEQSKAIEPYIAAAVLANELELMLGMI